MRGVFKHARSYIFTFHHTVSPSYRMMWKKKEEKEEKGGGREVEEVTNNKEDWTQYRHSKENSQLRRQEKKVPG